MTPDPREDALAKQTTALCLKIGKYGMVCKNGQYGCEQAAFETCDCKREPEIQAYRAIYEALAALSAPPSQSESDAQKMREGDVALIGDDHGIVMTGRWVGWKVWKHPDGQWVTIEKLEIVSQPWGHQ